MSNKKQENDVLTLTEGVVIYDNNIYFLSGKLSTFMMLVFNISSKEGGWKLVKEVFKYSYNSKEGGGSIFWAIDFIKITNIYNNVFIYINQGEEVIIQPFDSKIYIKKNSKEVFDNIYNTAIKLGYNQERIDAIVKENDISF